MKPVASRRLADPDAELVRQSHADAIIELQGRPAIAAQLIEGVVIPNASDLFVSHRLGRPPRMVIASPPRTGATAGLVRELESPHPVTGVPFDRARVICLRADGFGAEITIDVEVK